MSDLPPPPSQPSSPVPPPPPPVALTPPPGYVGYEAPPPSSAPLRRIGGLATAATVLAIVAGVGTVLGALVSGAARGDARDYLNGSITEREFLDAYAPAVMFSVVQGAAFVALVVVTMIWMYRMAANHRALGRSGSWGPGWAIGGWFLPPMVLYVIPYLMFRELWKASDPSAPGDTERWREGSVSMVVTVWWVLYGLVPIVFTGVQGVRTFRGGLNAGDSTTLAETLDDQYALSVVAALVTFAASVAYVLLVRGLSDRHRALTREASTRR